MRKKWIIVSLVCTVFLIGAALIGPIMSNVAQPHYEVIASEENVEIRRYAPMIVAEVEVVGKREDAIGDGFRLLADYIFGNNMLKKDVAMMAPVQQEEFQKIEMTAPVQIQGDHKAWNISFVMPSEYSIESLPKPNNDRVKLKNVPAKKFVVIQFSGTNSERNLTEHKKKLIDYIESNHIEITGRPKYAFYNPPWTLPFMRRNEVMIEVKDQE